MKTDITLLPKRRVLLFAGHYGSGKTNVAINVAKALRRAEPAREVVLADLDIVNPYFRTQDSADELRAAGIGLVVSEYANSNVDFPAMPKEAYALFASRETRVVVDVGGDDRGALALGRYVPDLRAENDFAMLGVINGSRPLTRTAADTVEVLREVEAACGLPFAGLVNDTNLGLETRPEDVLAGCAYAAEVAAAMGLPIVMTCAEASVAARLEGKVDRLFPLAIQRLYYQDRRRVGS